MKLICEHIITEKFTEDSDPIADMNIGMKHQIKKWVETETEYKYIEKDLLWICAQVGKTEFIKYLLDAGADVHAENDLALQWASNNGHDKVVKLLLDAGADVHAKNDCALRWASENGHDKVVKLLLDAGADVHADDDYALRWASSNGHDKVVKLLLDAGADVHVENDLALQWANYYRHDKVVKLLKDHIAKEKKNKIVKESLNEKFIEDSDPITDMGIGLKNFWKKEYKRIGRSKVTLIYNEFFLEYNHILDTLNIFITDEKIIQLFYLTLKLIVENNLRPKNAFRKSCRNNNFDNNTDEEIKVREIIVDVLKKKFFMDDINPKFSLIK